MAKAVLGAQHVVADEVMLLLDLAHDRVGTADQRQAVVDPEIVGLGPLPETRRSSRRSGVPASPVYMPSGPYPRRVRAIVSCAVALKAGSAIRAWRDVRRPLPSPVRQSLRHAHAASRRRAA